MPYVNTSKICSIQQNSWMHTNSEEIPSMHPTIYPAYCFPQFSVTTNTWLGMCCYWSMENKKNLAIASGLCKMQSG